jgi:hypothetical protein
MNRSVLRSLVRTGILAAVVAAPVSAQTTCSVSGASGKCSSLVSLASPATITNPALLQFTVSPSATLTSTATVTDMDVVDGMSTGSIATVTVQGNRTWSISVKGNSALWTASSGAWTSKPVSDLHWSLTPVGASTALSTTGGTLLSGAPGAGTPTTVYFRPVVHWLTDKPGAYSMGITFTVTAP